MEKEIIAAGINACSIVVASMFLPKFFEKKRHENDRKDVLIAKKEEALAKFLSGANYILLTQGSYNIYTTKQSDTTASEEDRAYYKQLVRKLYEKYIFSEHPYEVACILAQLEFPHLHYKIARFRSCVDFYIGLRHNNEFVESCGQCLCKQYSELAEKMTEKVAEIRRQQTRSEDCKGFAASFASLKSKIRKFTKIFSNTHFENK